jgi:hypothetical protein
VLTSPISQLWLLALIPVGLTIMPMDELTMMLVWMLAAHAAVELLLANDLRRYKSPTAKN